MPSVSGSMVSTTLSLSGLTPGKAHIAHYHAFGQDSSTNPCASNGPVSVSFPNFKADASGNASVTLKTDMSKIEGDKGAYINVHYASDPSYGFRIYLVIYEHGKALLSYRVQAWRG